MFNFVVKTIIKPNFNKKNIIILIVLMAITVGFFHLPAKWIYDPDATVCIHKRIFGIGCPLCGMTRAMYDLLHFNITKAITENFAIIPFTLLLVIGLIYLLYPLKMKRIFFVMVYITLAIFMLVYILRITGLY
jgi:hypothetical protein